MDLELIVWRDAWSDHEWTEVSEIKCEPYVITSCGLVVKENASGVVLALDRTGTGEVNSYGFIPAECIVCRTKLVPVTSPAPEASVTGDR